MGFEVHETVSRIKIHMNEQSRALKIMRIFQAVTDVFFLTLNAAMAQATAKRVQSKISKLMMTLMGSVYHVWKTRC